MSSDTSGSRTTAPAGAAAADDLLALPAVRLAELVRTRALSPVELLEVHLARLEAVEPAINAVVARRVEAARAEARAAEAAVRGARDRRELPPLLGVPCTIKDFLAVAGLSWTAGLFSRRHVLAERDATVVARLRAAGAIVVAKSNVPEGGMWMETSNPLHGRTRNPWDLARTPGGSSGGEAALVAAGASPLGIGSDIAGSVRIPAGMCGVVGHKPTSLLVPNTGHWGPAGGAAEAMLCTGPITRTVADAERVLELIAGPDGASAVERRLPPAEPALAAGDLRDVTVYPVTRHGRVRIAPVMAAAVERAAAALAARGATVVELDDATWRRLFGGNVLAWLAALAETGRPEPGAAPTSFAALLAGDEPLRVVPELWRAARGRARYSLPTLGLVALERALRPFEAVLARGAPPVASLQAGLEEVLGPRGVLLHPPYSRPAPRHVWPLLTPFDAVCTSLFSITGLPATVVPVGFDAQHLPVGVQVVGRRGADRLTLAAARALEAAWGGWTPAPVPRPAG